MKIVMFFERDHLRMAEVTKETIQMIKFTRIPQLGFNYPDGKSVYKSDVIYLGELTPDVSTIFNTYNKDYSKYLDDISELSIKLENTQSDISNKLKSLKSNIRTEYN